jgi:hypothetical protein
MKGKTITTTYIDETEKAYCWSILKNMDFFSKQRFRTTKMNRYERRYKFIGRKKSR